MTVQETRSVSCNCIIFGLCLKLMNMSLKIQTTLRSSFLALDKIIVCLLINACSQELIQIDMLSTVLYINKVSTYDSVSRS